MNTCCIIRKPKAMRNSACGTLGEEHWSRGDSLEHSEGEIASSPLDLSDEERGNTIHDVLCRALEGRKEGGKEGEVTLWAFCGHYLCHEPFRFTAQFAHQLPETPGFLIYQAPSGCGDVTGQMSFIISMETSFPPDSRRNLQPIRPPPLPVFVPLRLPSAPR